MNIRILAIALITVSGFCLFADSLNAKHNSVAHVMDVVTALTRVAKERSLGQIDDKTAQRKLSPLLESMKDTSEIAKVAIVCRALSFPQDAADVHFDGVLDKAFWLCVERLAATRNKDTSSALAEISRMADLQGGDRRAFNDIVSANAIHDRR